MSIRNIFTAPRRLIADKAGVTAVEYGVLGALIIVVCIAIITTLGTNLSTTFGNISGAL